VSNPLSTPVTRLWYVWVVGGFVLVSIVAALVVLLIEGKDPGPLVDFLTTKIVPAIAAFYGLINYTKIKKVEHQTNGTTTALTDINAAQSAALANSVPAPAVAPLLAQAIIPPAGTPPAEPDPTT